MLLIIGNRIAEGPKLPNKVLQTDDHLGRFAPSIARR